MGRLDGKIAIITGAASGQGEAEAHLFAAEGAEIMITDVSDKIGDVAAAVGGSTIFMRQDVSQPDGWAEVVAKTVQHFGGVDVLINNAGVFAAKSMLDTTVEDFERMFRVNALGVILGMQAVVEPMKARKGGSIVNVASVSAMRHIPGQFAYAGSKWAVRGLSGCAAAELGRFGIRVNAVHPGMIQTPMIEGNTPETNARYASMIPLKRIGSAKEVAEVATFLASDASSYMSGADLVVSAGADL